MGTSGELEDRLAAEAPSRSSVELRRAERAIENRLFGTRRAPLTLSRYVLLQRIAMGGGGVVYTAYDPELDRKVAMKLVHARAHGKSDTQEARARLLREAQAMARLSHPNVMPVHDVGTYDLEDLGLDADGTGSDIPPRGVFLVMELVEGDDLREWLRQRPRRWRELLGVFREAGRGLVAAHEAGLVHRDFKPSNVIVGRDGRVRVLDFGLARALDAPEEDGESPRAPEDRTDAPLESVSPTHLGSPITRRGAIVGTPAYMSPEQHRGDRVDERTDQFSFCLALYEALYGQRPYEGNTLDELANAKAEARLRPPPQSTRVPRWLHRIVVRGLQAAPVSRFEDMGVLVEQLERDPGRRLRRGLLAVSAITLVGTLGYGARSDQDERCTGQERELLGVWDEDARADIQRSFRATDLPYAEDAVRTVIDELDDYTKRWVSRRAEVCRATLVAGAQPMAVMSQRLLCLDRRLVRVGGLTQLFRRADVETVQRAAAAVAALPDVDSCARLAAERARTLPPAGREDILAVEALLAEALALATAARYQESERMAERALERARRIDDPALRARSHFQVGHARMRTGAYEAAEAATREGLHAAEQAFDDELTVSVMIRLAFIVGAIRGRTREAIDLLDHTEARRRAAGLGPSSRQRVLYTRGRALEVGGRYGEALEAFGQALELAETAASPNPTTIADLMNNIGVAHDRLGQDEQALHYYEKALAGRRVLGESHPDYGNAVGNVGIMLARVGRFEESIATLEESIAIHERALGPSHPGVAWRVANLGHVLGLLGSYEQALAQQQRALAMREKSLGPDHVEVALSLTALAGAFGELGLWEQAVASAQRAVDTHERGSTNLPRLGSALHQLAFSLHGMGRVDRALPVYARARDVLEPTLGAVHTTLADLLTDTGRCVLDSGDRERAIELLERAVQIREQANSPSLHRAPAHFALARALATADHTRARELATLARTAYDQVAPRRRELPEVIRWLEQHDRDRPKQ